MDVQPNTNCKNFCDFLNENRWLHTTPPQRNLINYIRAAAESVTPVTAQKWAEFLKVTSSHYPYYTASKEQLI